MTPKYSKYELKRMKIQSSKRVREVPEAQTLIPKMAMKYYQPKITHLVFLQLKVQIEEAR